MRDLTKGQKKYLGRVIKSNPNIRDIDDLPLEDWENLVEMHDTEILYQNVNSYIIDEWFKENRNKDPWLKN